MDTVSRARPRYATAKVRNISAIPEVLREFGADIPAVMSAAGVDPNLFADPENVIPYAALGRLATASVRATGSDSFGLSVGMRMGASAMGLTGLVSMNSPTVREALQVVIATLKTSDSGGATFLDVRDGVAAFGYAVTAPGVESADQIVDGAMAIAFNLMRQLRGPAWRPNRVRLTRDPPRDKALFAKFFAAPIDYAAPSAALVFDAATLDAPVRGRDPDYATVLAPLLEAAAAGASDDFLASVRSVIRAQIGLGALSRASLSRALGLNARTFAHRLAGHGVTYSGLADEARYEAAQGLLRKGKPIAEIAAALGFAEPSAFTRAFRAWSGTTPARWRRGRAAPS